LKSNVSQSSQSSFEKFPASSVEPETNTIGYTPSGLQKKEIKDLTRTNTEAHGSIPLDKDTISSIKSDSFSSNNDNNSNKAVNELAKSNSKPTAKPVVPSHFSPVRHKSYDDTDEVSFMFAMNNYRIAYIILLSLNV